MRCMTLEKLAEKEEESKLHLNGIIKIHGRNLASQKG